MFSYSYTHNWKRSVKIGVFLSMVWQPGKINTNISTIWKIKHLFFGWYQFRKIEFSYDVTNIFSLWRMNSHFTFRDNSTKIHSPEKLSRFLEHFSFNETPQLLRMIKMRFWKQEWKCDAWCLSGKTHWFFVFEIISE